jgi:hypothetical protein
VREETLLSSEIFLREETLLSEIFLERNIVIIFQKYSLEKKTPPSYFTNIPERQNPIAILQKYPGEETLLSKFRNITKRKKHNCHSSEIFL